MKRTILALTALLALSAASVQAAAKQFNGGEVYSKELVKYGRWEMRMQMPRLGGAVSSFFTYEPDSWMGDTHPWREIDIEYLGNKNTGFQSNIITGWAESKLMSEKFHVTDADPGSGFHTYVLEWTPDSVRWFFDSKLIRSTTSQNSDQVAEMQDLPQTFRMNIWASTSVGWVGRFDSASLPAYQVIKYMKYAAYTPGAGPEGADFTPSWTDSFKTFDTKRWAKADWTFGENYVDFKPSNVLVKDNHLVLCLTRADAPGLLGDFPRDTATATSIGSRSNPKTALALRAGQGALRLEVPESLGNWSLAVHDLAGRVLAKQQGNGARQLEIPVAGKGIRIVRVQGEREQFEGRIVQ